MLFRFRFLTLPRNHLEYSLHYERFPGVVQWLIKQRGNGMVSGCGLHHEPVVTLNTREHRWLFDRPLAAVAENFFSTLVLFGCIAAAPPLIPTGRELLDEYRFYCRWL
jgi:hypothetical protein